MKKTVFEFDGAEYATEWALRQAIGKAEGRRAFGPAPEKDAEAWWRERGVTMRGEEIQAAKPSAETLALIERGKAKTKRASAVREIVVEVGGVKLQGDETSQGRMANAVVAAMASGAGWQSQTVEWKLADNSTATLTLGQLAEALKLARDAQQAVWL